MTEPDGGAQRTQTDVPKVERPRDELGRPLPAGATSRLRLEAFEQFDLQTNHRLAVQHFNAGQYFGAHEAWETCWRLSRGTADEAFFKGLSQLGAGYTHYRRGNAHGARALLGRAVTGIGPYAPRHRGLHVLAIVSAAESHAERFRAAEEAGLPPPEVSVPPLELGDAGDIGE